ncbi:D-alanyl-D-alanine carboxypeptidase [Candidatus Parcubacteria bacterium]|nr:MAG: D-alanyl-D-alanine carboxypeptidase [Candidatus Parcubacteria bacterium]
MHMRKKKSLLLVLLLVAAFIAGGVSLFLIERAAAPRTIIITRTSGKQKTYAHQLPPASEQKRAVVSDAAGREKFLRRGDHELRESAPAAVLSALPLEKAAFSPKGGNAANAAPQFQGAAAVVADVTTGKVYFSYYPEKRWPIASLTKLMTAVIATEHIPPQQEILLEQRHFPFDAGTPVLAPGEKYSASDLLKVMLIASSNEAAEALADFYGREKFIQEMNRRAKEWQLSHTVFYDPTGLSASNQSTAQDLKKLVGILYGKYPQFFLITSKPKEIIYDLNSGAAKEIHSTNVFAGDPGFLGGKTGYIDESGGNLISVFLYGRPVVFIVLGTTHRFGATAKLFRWFIHTYRPLGNNG